MRCISRMILRKAVVAIIAFATSSIVTAQTSNYKVELPQVLPASPEPSAFVKAGVGNTNMSTGAASANIPLYNIKIRDFAFPLSLSYSTQGLKADEASSRVGLGWVLNATAMITRSVKGKPDEFAERMPVPADFSSTHDSVYNYLAYATDLYSGGDSQPDEFQFTCNGYSGKFVLDNNYIPRVTATSNVKIEVQILVTPGSTSGGISIITITTPDGIKYKFGGAYERTITYNIGANNPFRDITKTAFFLDKIELPTGEYIQFNYVPLNISVVTGITQTLQLAKVDGQNGCEGCSSRNSYTNQENKVDYRTNYLSSITTSDGLNIELTYEPRNDQSNDVRLSGLSVEGIKEFKFNYYNVPISPTAVVTTGRFFLTRIREIKLAEVINTDSSYDYILTYDHLDEVPLPITFSQDYLGYYNGNTSNNCLVPPALNSNNTIDFSFRNPNWTQARKGTLTAIQYPTGGREEFIYEANTTGEYVHTKRNTYVNAHLEGNGGTGGSYAVYTFNNLQVLKNHTATLSASADDAILNDGYTADPALNTVILRLYDGTTVVASRSVLGYSPTSVTIELLAGHTYKLELTVKNSTERGFGTLSYDPTAEDIYDDIYMEKEVPGIRVKQIRYTDPVTLATHSKYYKYARLADLLASTGGLAGIPIFKSMVVSKNFCGQFGDLETRCVIDIYSSNSTNDVYSLAGSGSLLYYKTVIESDDPDFKNGGTEYTFYDNEQGGNHQSMLGQGVPYLSAGQYPTLSGTVYTTRVFNKDKAIVRSTRTDYETLIYLNNSTTSIYARKNYEPYITRPDRMEAFDAVKTHYGSWWIRQKTQWDTAFTGTAFQATKTDYTYGTPANILPASTITKDSKQQELKTETKYPTDFPGDAVSDKLVAKNIITPAILQSSYRNSILQQQKKVIYKDWFNDNKTLLPQIIQLKQSPADVLQNALEFTKYDTKGKALEFSKPGDMQIVYLWDTLHGLPVCEVKGATFSQVAFSGFETGADLGYWQLVSGGGGQSPAFTGQYSFTGTLSKTITLSGTYVVRLWTNTSATVNGTAGTQIKTNRGWTLYEWKLVNPSTITVQGTKIDDVRLHPQQALMATYAYKPFVGPTSKSDENGNLLYYEYDHMSRLVALRDIDNNVLKNYAYQYAANNDTKASVWQPTSATRCVPCTINTAYNSTLQQREEKDISPQSSTYNQTRWVNVGIEGSCKVNAVWQNTATSPRCVKDAGGSNNTGVQEQEQMDVNPCSNTYNQTRWVVTGTNYTACPLPCPNCTTIDKKCINGVCVTGLQMLVSSTPLSGNQWECVYRYEFPDGTWSSNYTVITTNGCPVD